MTQGGFTGDFNDACSVTWNIIDNVNKWNFEIIGNMGLCLDLFRPNGGHLDVCECYFIILL